MVCHYYYHSVDGAPRHRQQRQQLQELVGTNDWGLALFLPLDLDALCSSPGTRDDSKDAQEQIATAAGDQFTRIPILNPTRALDPDLETNESFVLDFDSLDGMIPRTANATAMKPILRRQTVQDGKVGRQDLSPACSTITTATDAEDSCTANDSFDYCGDVMVIEPPSDDTTGNNDPSRRRILNAVMIHQIRNEGLPESLQQNQWERCYCIGRDGDSFITLLDRCARYTCTVIVIRTAAGHVLGGFASHAWREQEGYSHRHAYFGTGQSFLFASHPDIILSDDTTEREEASPSTTTTTTAGCDSQRPLSLYKWTGCNDYIQLLDVDRGRLIMGGGGDCFGWIVHDNFSKGQTGRCDTFGNPPLVPGSAAHAGGNTFEVEAFEVYGLVPLFQSF